MLPWNHRLPLALAALAMLIIITGGWVRIADAGESCPDWPACFGGWQFDVPSGEQQAWWAEHPGEADRRWLDDPEFAYSTGQIFTEWLHRLLVGLIALPVLWSHYAVWQRRAALPGAAEAHLHATLLLLAQAAVGAITVGFDNAPWSVALHLLLALAFVTALLRVALMARLAEGPLPERFRVPREVASQQARLVAGLVLAALALLLVGAWLATGYHRGACGGGWEAWPLCEGMLLPGLELGVMAQMLHRLLAVGVGAALFWGGQWLRNNGGRSVVTRLVDGALGVFVLNLFVGGFYLVMASDSDYPGWLSLLHLLLGVVTFLHLAVAWLLCTEPLRG